MSAKTVISCLLILTLVLPPGTAWGQAAAASQGGQAATAQPGPASPGAGPGPAPGQELVNQAQFYLQKIDSGTGVSPAAPPQAQAPQPRQAQPPAARPAPSAAKAPAESRAPLGELTAMEKRSRDQGMALSHFGYDLFSQAPSTFLPATAVPVGPDYLIGPGDIVRIAVWGNFQAEYSLTVDRNGQVSIPKVGVVQVSGLTFRQLKEVLDRELSRLYNNFQMNVTLDNLRTITVYVVGQARFPGSYAISSLSTLINALFAAGGPALSGSMRDIRVRRSGKVIVHFDVYDLIMKGDKTRDIRLMPEDVIFIPMAGTRAGIGGPVKAQAIYELKGERTLTDLLRLAGGLDPSAFKSRVQIFRYQDHKEMTLTADDLEKFLTGRRPDIAMNDGDLIKIFPVPGLSVRMVRVTGAVQSPGEFCYRDGMCLKDLITIAGGLLMHANQEEAEITRVTASPEGPQTDRLYVSLRRALAGYPRDNVSLRPNDYLFVRTVPEWALYKTVNVGGEVKYTGTYSIKKGETLSSLLERAGGFTDRAYPKGAVFTRVEVRETQQRHLKQAIDRIEAEILATSTKKATAELSKEEAERQQMVVAQQQQLLAKLREIQALGRVVIYLDDPERLRGTPYDLELQEGDSLSVPTVHQTINVMGSVVNPTAVVYEPGLTVQDYIARAGGATKNADLKGTYLIRVNGEAVSRRGFKFFGSIKDGPTTAYHVGGFNSLRLEPGDSIIVPEELERVAWLKEIKDIATIFGQIALTAGVVFAALK